MLVLSRKLGEQIIIDDRICIRSWQSREVTCGSASAPPKVSLWIDKKFTKDARTLSGSHHQFYQYHQRPIPV